MEGRSGSRGGQVKNPDSHAGRGGDARTGRSSFLILLVGVTMADLRWLPCGDPDPTDAEAALMELLDRDDKRRRWLGAGVVGPGSQG